MDAPTLLRTTSILGISTSLFMSGIHFSASHLTLPLLYHLPVETSSSVFAEYYHSGARTVVPLSIVSSIFTGVAAYLDPQKRVGYAVAAAATFATLPFTTLVIMSVNKRLLAIAGDQTVREKAADGEVEMLLRRWTTLNMVRAVMGGVGGMLGFAVFAGGL